MPSRLCLSSQIPPSGAPYVQSRLESLINLGILSLTPASMRHKIRNDGPQHGPNDFELPANVAIKGQLGTQNSD
jgi:hypothetical protein